MGSYFGSKATSGLCQPIIALMPPHDTYIETHLGGGAIMKRKPPALHNRCQPWRAKRRLVDPSSREAALFSRRALCARGKTK